MKTKMYQEIQDQPIVATKVLDYYLGKANHYRDIIQKKKNIILMGTGASLYACEMSKYAFYRYTEILPMVIPAADAKYVIKNIDKDSLIIIVSQSGDSYETKVIADALKEKGVAFWGITNNPNSHLAQKADEVLLLMAGEEVSSATKTNMASLLLLYIIAAGYNEKAKIALQKIPDLLKKALHSSEEGISYFTKALKDCENIYVLGIATSGAIAMQGALMLKEKTFIHTSGMSISDFRHGTVEVVSPGLPIVLLASSKEQVEEMVIHFHFLKERQADIYCIVCCEHEKIDIPKEKIIFFETSDVEELSAITMIIPLQMLAENIAFENGYDVDGFRYLSKVVDKY